MDRDLCPACAASESVSAETPCDGVHPVTGQMCLRRWHAGYHEAADGSQWLDD